MTILQKKDWNNQNTKYLANMLEEEEDCRGLKISQEGIQSTGKAFTSFSMVPVRQLLSI